VKYLGRSHIHNEWVPESTLMQIAKRKAANFKRRYSEAGPCSLMQEQWQVPERLIARRACPHAPGWEVLVKWAGLGYEHATWEVRSSWRNS
jgi:hypothetical protein